MYKQKLDNKLLTGVKVSKFMQKRSYSIASLLKKMMPKFWWKKRPLLRLKVWSNMVK